MTSLRLRWGIKASFRDYLSGLDDLTIELSDGAERTVDGGFGWPVVDHGDQRIAARGRVHLRAHGGMLDVVLADPVLETPSDSATLSFQTAAGPAEFAKGVVEARDPLVVALTITFVGASLLGGIYPPGTRLDDASVGTAG